jgi:hypothetical protein
MKTHLIYIIPTFLLILSSCGEEQFSESNPPTDLCGCSDYMLPIMTEMLEVSGNKKKSDSLAASNKDNQLIVDCQKIIEDAGKEYTVENYPELEGLSNEEGTKEITKIIGCDGFEKFMDISNELMAKVVEKMQEQELEEKQNELETLYNWTLRSYVDEFGDETGKGYVNKIVSGGTFSNSAANSADLNAIIFIENNEIALRLLEYGDNPVKNSGRDADDYIIKTKIGEDTQEYKGKLWTDRIKIDGEVTGLIESLKTENEIKFYIEEVTKYSSSTYKFTYENPGNLTSTLDELNQ